MSNKSRLEIKSIATEMLNKNLPVVIRDLKFEDEIFEPNLEEVSGGEKGHKSRVCLHRTDVST